MPTSTLQPQKKSDELDLHLKVLGRTLEHFGVQMYKQRPAAIAELVANCWDAGASRATVTVPPTKDRGRPATEIVIQDDGRGMSEQDVQAAYLVLGRNRRQDGDLAGTEIDGRRIMGHKGIGKLAGFGIADEMEVRTWREGKGTEFTLILEELKTGDDEVTNVPIRGERFIPNHVNGPSGTQLTLRRLRNKTPLDADELRRSLARRFSRVVCGKMSITVNEEDLPDPLADYEILKITPDSFPDELDEYILPSGKTVKYGYAFTKGTIKNSEMQGFTVLVHGKTAQAPPFFFRVESTATGQHATRYVSGVIEADFLDDAIDSQSDVISTDRQEIDWDHVACKELLEWGKEIARKALADCTEFRGRKRTEELGLDPSFKQRIAALDPQSRKQVHKMIGVIGYTDAGDDRTKELVDSLLSVFEFRHFHDMVEDIEKVAEKPELLVERLELIREWKVLESRAIYEVIGGRLAIIEMFEKALADDAPETAHRVGQSNLHDAIGRFPWLINPDFHIYTEEKSIATLLREWADKDYEGSDRQRVDFAALGDDHNLVIIEIKRAGDAVEFGEIQRFEGYAEKLAKQTSKDVKQILIYGGCLNVSPQKSSELEQSDHVELRRYGTLLDATKRRYKRYHAILKGEIEHRDFAEAAREAGEIRGVIETGSFYRTREERKNGLGSQAE
jgi:hypothetical protein